MNNKMMMYLNKILFCLTFLISAVFSSSYTENDQLVLKLDHIERAFFDDSQMPVEKLHQLMDAEISLENYFDYPWLRLGISEKDWILQHKAGIVHPDDTFGNTKQIASREWAVIQNFFFPGMHQFKRHQTFKGFLMSGIAVASVALFALHKNPDDKNSLGFDYPQYFFLLGADCIWSAIDLGVQLKRENEKEMLRFSYNITIPIKVISRKSKIES
jgi:hypothetical protein